MIRLIRGDLLRKIIKYSLFQIIIKFKRFLFEILMMLIAFVILQYAVIDNFTDHLMEKTTKKLLSHKLEVVYNLNLDLYIQNFATIDDQDNLISFFSDLTSIDGIEQSGEFWFCPIGEANENNELYISTTLMGLCDDMEDAQLALSKHIGIDDVCPVAVGNDLLDELPVGTKFHNKQYNIDCIVVSVLDENIEWIAPKYTDLQSIPLNDCIIYPVEYLYGVRPFFAINGLNNAYVALSSTANVEDTLLTIDNMAKENEIILNDIINMDEYFRIQVMRSRDAIGERVIMPTILFVISIATIVLVSIISLKQNIRNLGIMLSSGMTRTEISAIYFVENVVKLSISFWLAYLYWYINISSIWYSSFAALKDITFVMVMCLIILLLLLNIVPYAVLSKYKPIQMIGGEC